jgi:hypothetical protein
MKDTGAGLNVSVEAQVLAARMKPRAPALAEPQHACLLVGHPLLQSGK